MKRVVAVEGPDGSGKTHLIDSLRALADERQIPFTVIDRKSASVPASVRDITRMLRRGLVAGSDGLPPRADIGLRLAREAVRATMAASVPDGLVIFDRFVISVASRLTILPPWVDEGNSLAASEVAAITLLLGRVSQIAGLAGTLYCRCSFETSWGRTTARGAQLGLSPKEALGVELNRAIACEMDRLVRVGGPMVQVCREINTEGSVAATRGNLLELLDEWFY